jgi:hypothetical protein
MERQAMARANRRRDVVETPAGPVYLTSEEGRSALQNWKPGAAVFLKEPERSEFRAWLAQTSYTT